MSSIGVDWEARVDWNELRRARLERMRQAMKETDVAGLIVHRFDNLKYLTSVRPFTSLVYYPRYAAFLPQEGPVCLLTEAGDYELNRGSMPWIEDLRVWPYDLIEAIRTLELILREYELESSRIAYDDIVSPTTIGGLKTIFPEAAFVDGTDMIGEAKAIKHPQEILVIKQATEIAEVGITAALDVIREGVKECEVAGEATRAMFAAGADTLIAYPQISTDPLRRMATDKRIRNGDLVLVDINIGYNGYIGDSARTVAVGKPSAEQRRTYRVQLECVKAAIGLVKDGVDANSIQKSVKEITETAGLSDYWHAYITGHGVGTSLAPYEQPMIGSTMGPETTLKTGMVIAFEPGFFRPGVGPVRVEEVVLTTHDGYEQLTTMSYDERLLD